MQKEATFEDLGELSTCGEIHYNLDAYNYSKVDLFIETYCSVILERPDLNTMF